MNGLGFTGLTCTCQSVSREMSADGQRTHTGDILVCAQGSLRTLKSRKREAEHSHANRSRRRRRTDMSDREGHVGSGSADDDLSLPKATVAKMITGECTTKLMH